MTSHPVSKNTSGHSVDKTASKDMALSLGATVKLCIDCQKAATEETGTIRLKCKKHVICDNCCDNREVSSEFTRKIRECQKCYPEVFHAQPPKVWIYVDDSNLWISGKKAYAEAHNLLTSNDPRARFDIGQLNEVIAEGREACVSGRTLYGSKPPPVDTVWAKVEEQGWSVDIKQKSYHTGKEKQVDVQLVADVVSLVNREKTGTVIIVSGDSDYIPAINEAFVRGWKVEVWSWEKALSADIRDHERKGNGLRVEYLNQHLQKIMYVNCDFDPSRFNEEGLLSRLREASILLTVSKKDLQGGRKWEEFTNTLQIITKWPISYFQVAKAKGYVEVLAIFLSGPDEKPDIDRCIKLIGKAKKKLNLTTNPMQFSDLHDKFGDKLEWLKPLLSHCKGPAEEYEDDASDTRSVHSSRSRSSIRQRSAEKRIKTELCRHHARSSCSKGNKCNFAHGERDPMAWCVICEKKGHIAGDMCQKD